MCIFEVVDWGFLLTDRRYEHYFEKDVGFQLLWKNFGHRHDWENIVVIVRDGEEQPAYVAASAHGGYETKPAGEVRFDGMSPFFM